MPSSKPTDLPTQTRVPNERLNGLVQIWRSVAPDRNLPSRSDFLPEGNLRPWLGDIAIVEVEQDPLRFKARMVGTNIVREDGRDITSLYLDEALPDRYQTEVKRPFKTAIDTQKAVYNEIAFGQEMLKFAAQLVLPLSSGSSRVDGLIMCVSLQRPVSTPNDILLLDAVAEGKAEPRNLLLVGRSTP